MLHSDRHQGEPTVKASLRGGVSARLPSVATALWAQAESRRLARELQGARIPAMILKGPDLQERLYGTPAAYASSDVDILIPRSMAHRARRALTEAGWRFEADNGVLWRVSAAASFERDGFRSDVHWGLHAAHLPSIVFRSLERSMWRHASWGSGGFLVPDVHSLLVFLAVHVAGHAYERPQWQENVRRCAEQVESWDDVWRIAAEANVTRSVKAALEGRPPGHVEPLLDGWSGLAIWRASLVLRGHTLPAAWRAETRERIALWREGYGALALGNPERCEFDGFTFEVDRGVFAPRSVSEQLVRLALASVEDEPAPTIVEMGTGSGAISVALARRRPGARVLASDVSPRAVRCAKRNAARARAKVELAVGSLMDTMPDELFGHIDVVIGNLPYVEPRGAARVGDWGAPSHAIVGGGTDGMGLVREGARQAARYLRPGGWLVFQIADWQFDFFEQELEEMGFRCEVPAARRSGKALTARAQWRDNYE